MKNPMEVLRVKEQELVKVRREVDALRISARLRKNRAGRFEARCASSDRNDIAHLLLRCGRLVATVRHSPPCFTHTLVKR